MAKKRARHDNEPGKSAADYYKLKTQAVDDLVNADASNSPEVSREELKKYRAYKRGFPNWIKVCLIKLWFAGAVCFFFLWGLGVYMNSMLDLLFITGIVLGMVTDLLTNNVLRFISEEEGSNDRWIMFPKKRFATFFLNIAYAFLLLFLVWSIYAGLNILLIRLTGAAQDSVPLGVEPVLFGTFYMLCDVLLLSVKSFCAGRIRGAKN